MLTRTRYMNIYKYIDNKYKPITDQDLDNKLQYILKICEDIIEDQSIWEKVIWTFMNLINALKTWNIQLNVLDSIIHKILLLIYLFGN